MNSQVTVQKLLQERMVEAKVRNPAFSMRALSRKLGLSPAMLSRVLSGQRKVSSRLAKRIVEALMLDPQEQSEILSRFPADKRQAPTDAVDPLYLQLSADHFRMISEWRYFAILSLFKTRGFKGDVQWIGERLGLPAPAVARSLERLQRLGLVEKDASGRLVRSPSRYRTSDDVTNLSIRKAHFESLELARESLESDTVENRDFTSLTLAFPADRMSEAKRMIRKFEDDFDAEFEGGKSDPTEVYRLCVALFPLTQPKERK